MLGLEPRVSWVLSKHSTNLAASLAPKVWSPRGEFCKLFMVVLARTAVGSLGLILRIRIPDNGDIRIVLTKVSACF